MTSHLPPWEEQLPKIHYEPEHEKGETCWCDPKSSMVDGIYNIDHIAQREVLKDFIKGLLASQRETLAVSVEKLKRNNYANREWNAALTDAAAHIRKQ